MPSETRAFTLQDSVQDIVQAAVDERARPFETYSVAVEVWNRTYNAGSGQTIIDMDPASESSVFYYHNRGFGHAIQTSKSILTVPVAGRYLVSVVLEVNRNAGAAINVVLSVPGLNMPNRTVVPQGSGNYTISLFGVADRPDAGNQLYASVEPTGANLVISDSEIMFTYVGPIVS